MILHYTMSRDKSHPNDPTRIIHQCLKHHKSKDNKDTINPKLFQIQVQTISERPQKTLA